METGQQRAPGNEAEMHLAVIRLLLPDRTAVNTQEDAKAQKEAAEQLATAKATLAPYQATILEEKRLDLTAQFYANTYKGATTVIMDMNQTTKLLDPTYFLKKQ